MTVSLAFRRRAWEGRNQAIRDIKERLSKDLLWESTDHTPTQPLMAYSTYPFLAHNHAPIPPMIVAADRIAQEQVRLRGDTLYLSQGGDDFPLIRNRICSSHSAPEVKLQISNREFLRDKVEGRVGWETGAVSGEDFQGGAVLTVIAGRRREVEGQEDVVDR